MGKRENIYGETTDVKRFWIVAIALVISALALLGVIYLKNYFSQESLGSMEASVKQELLEVQNQARIDFGVPPMTWSDELEKSASEWAENLAQRGNLVHSRSGENLWLGTSKIFSPRAMVEAWLREKQYFYNGTFPNVSATGRWTDVGHYSQIVWEKTTSVGCGLASNGINDILVCHYEPKGNVVNESVKG